MQTIHVLWNKHENIAYQTKVLDPVCQEESQIREFRNFVSPDKFLHPTFPIAWGIYTATFRSAVNKQLDRNTRAYSQRLQPLNGIHEHPNISLQTLTHAHT
jgi:hypothetical protein